MQLRWIVLILAGVVGGAVYAEFIRDIRAPTASVAERHAVIARASFQVDDDYFATAEALRKKYGPGTETGFNTGPPVRVIALVNGKVVEERPASVKFRDVEGLFVIAPPGRRESFFPFRIDPREAPRLGRTQLEARDLKGRLGRQLPA